RRDGRRGPAARRRPSPRHTRRGSRGQAYSAVSQWICPAKIALVRRMTSSRCASPLCPDSVTDTSSDCPLCLIGPHASTAKLLHGGSPLHSGGPNTCISPPSHGGRPVGSTRLLTSKAVLGSLKVARIVFSNDEPLRLASIFSACSLARKTALLTAWMWIARDG